MSTRVKFVLFVIALLAVHGASLGLPAEPECMRFDEIYPSGKELCEEMWDDAFVYESNESIAYTMWFFESQNPNDRIAQSLGLLDSGGHDTCHLQYFHKDAPGPEPDDFTECHPWKAEACCAHGTVETQAKLKEGYGPEYHWDRCGPLSQECERFFVQEACFYECDPNAGLYRKFNASIYDASDSSHNKWQMHRMPIKASYCDAWFAACRNDNFCAHDGGDFFSCAKIYKQADDAAGTSDRLNKSLSELTRLTSELANLKTEHDGLNSGELVAIVAPSVLALFFVIVTCYLIKLERAGRPMFSKLLDGARQSGPSGETVGNPYF